MRKRVSRVLEVFIAVGVILAFAFEDARHG